MAKVIMNSTIIGPEHYDEYIISFTHARLNRIRGIRSQLHYLSNSLSI